jgi:tripartite-type tricarboxylate transporter receptor subunit TctC
MGSPPKRPAAASPSTGRHPRPGEAGSAVASGWSRIARRGLLALMASFPFSAAIAQGYPAKPVRIIVPQPPGGGFDTVGRLMADRMGKLAGQGYVVENRTGSGTLVGTDAAAKAAPDGYTLLVGSVSNLALNPGLYPNLPYDSLKDFEPVGLLVSYSYTLVGRKDLPYNNLQELLAYAKANPGKLNYGSAGNGTTHHLAGELFKTMAGVQLTHIPYKGAGPMMQDLLAGQVDMAFDGMGTSAPQIKAGKLKALAVTTAQRSFVDPSVPTMQEAGLPGYIVTTWYALWAVKGTPKEALDRMYQETVKALQAPEMKVVWEGQGATAGGEPPAEFAKLIHAEIAKWAKVVKDAGAKVDN